MKIYYAFVALLSFFILNSSPLQGQTTAPKVKKIPFHGKLASVDASAQTVTVGGKKLRVFHLTPTTRVIDGSGNPSSLSAAVVGEDVGGSYAKDASGNMLLFSLRLGAKTGQAAKASDTTEEAAPAAEAPAPAAPAPAMTPAPTMAASAGTADATPAPASKPRKQSFSGKVVSVDTAGSTLVIHGRTFTVTPTTKITDATGSATTLASINAGMKVSGSYMKSADGTTLTVYSLKIAK